MIFRSIHGKVTKEALLQQQHGGAPLQVEQKSGLVGFEVKKSTVQQGKDIHIEKIKIAYEGKTLLQETDLKIVDKRKYGIIGPNGSGKTTLLRHIANRELPIPENIKILYVEQEIEATDDTALEAVIKSDTERLELLAEEARLKELAKENTDEGVEANEKLIAVYERLREIGAYSAEARASAILSGFQFTEEMKQKPTRQFSGGWRMRIALARALFLSPDLLILDEPTNHLDLNAVIWLEHYLKKWKKTLLIVSHDRDFLNYFVTDIIWINNQKLNYYRGDYDTFERTHLIAEKTLEKQRKKQEKKLNQIHQKQTKSAKEEKAKMLKKGLIEKETKKYTVSFNFGEPEKLKRPIIEVRDASFGYEDGKMLFENLDLNIDLDSKIAIVGPNGAGKTTLINLILGNLEPTSGEVFINRKLVVMKFAQHFVEELEMSENAIAYIQKSFPDMTPHDIRQHLGKFGLTGKTHTNAINLLSGGQKSRVMFAKIALHNPHILFLDEPTNHLDIQSVDALAEALQNFPGGIVLISHDQRLITRVCDELWVVKGDKNVTIYDGTFEDYRQELIDEMDDSLFEDSEEEKK